MNVRSGLYGGRTEAFRLLCVPKQNEQISYLDKNSLYPYVCKRMVYPWGPPEKITANFREVSESTRFMRRYYPQETSACLSYPKKFETNVFIPFVHHALFRSKTFPVTTVIENVR